MQVMIQPFYLLVLVRCGTTQGEVEVGEVLGRSEKLGAGGGRRRLPVREGHIFINVSSSLDGITMRGFPCSELNKRLH
jgi:hypothetical protein